MQYIIQSNGLVKLFLMLSADTLSLILLSDVTSDQLQVSACICCHADICYLAGSGAFSTHLHMSAHVIVLGRYRQTQLPAAFIAFMFYRAGRSRTSSQPR